MQDFSLLMGKGEGTKPTASNGLLPFLGTGNACVVTWFPTGSVGDSALKRVCLVTGDYFLCWHNIYFTCFSLKTGLVLFSGWVGTGVRKGRTNHLLFIWFCDNCKSIFSSAAFFCGIKNLSTLAFVPFIHTRVKMALHNSAFWPASGSLFCLYKPVVRFVWHTWQLRIARMCSA